jgi:hypothetical protein
MCSPYGKRLSAKGDDKCLQVGGQFWDVHHLVETGWWNLWWKPFAAEGEIVEGRAARCLVLGEQQTKATAAGERVGSEGFPFAHWDLHHIFAFGPIIVQRKLCGTEVRVGWDFRRLRLSVTSYFQEHRLTQLTIFTLPSATGPTAIQAWLTTAVLRTPKKARLIMWDALRVGSIPSELPGLVVIE